MALDLFSERGVRGTSIRHIARTAGVTEGLIYHYFGSKSGLIRAVIQRFTIAEEVAAQVAGAASLPADEALYRVAWRLFELLSQNRKYVTMVTTQAQRDPEVARVLGQMMLRGLQPSLALVQERIASGELRPHDPQVGLRFLHGSLLWYFLTHEKLSPPLPRVAPPRFVRGVVDIMLHGIIATPRPTRRRKT